MDSVLSEAFVLISLTQAEALVLFDIVARFDRNEGLSIQDQAEERVLWDLLTKLEKHVGHEYITGYNERVEQARDKVRAHPFEYLNAP